MPKFTTPLRYDTPRFHPNDIGHMKMLRAKQASTPVAVSVWLLKDGTVTQQQPTVDDLIARWFQGGGIHKISSDEATLLTGAGYTIIPDSIFPGAYPGGYMGGYGGSDKTGPVTPPIDLTGTYTELYGETY